MIVVPDEKKAREITMLRQGKYRESKIAEQQAMKLENIMTQMEDGQIISLNILIKLMSVISLVLAPLFV